MKVLVGNDNLVQVLGLQNKATSAYLNAATVTYSVDDLSGTEIVASTAMAYVADSDGDYRGTLADTESLVAGTDYVVKVTANAGGGLLGYWELTVTAKDRTE